MCRTLKHSERILGLFFIVLFLCTLSPAPILAAEKIFRNSLGMEFVLIPGGTFIMGSPTDEPHHFKNEVQHKVTITKPFYMQTTEVTLKQWWALMGKKFFGRRRGSHDMPVARVSWHDCMKFIKKLNGLNQGTYRLPTEAEWEYACRAGSTTAYGWGKTIYCNDAMYGNNTRKANECVDYIKTMGLADDQAAPVEHYKPNAWGIYDMHGNLWEWCQDWYGDYPHGSVVDPRGPDSGSNKLRRGGSWVGFGYRCRSANRAYANPSVKFKSTGFRLVREIR
jgi:formylglycine-generating enzyme required for sulfatase activity